MTLMTRHKTAASVVLALALIAGGVLLARPFAPEERFFYQKKMNQTLA